jgi:hypothetical protein
MPLSEFLDFVRHPAIRLFYMATGFGVSQALFVGTELEVFTRLEAGPLSAEEFCAALQLELRAGRALLAALVSLGLVRLKRGRYGNAPVAARWLVKGKADYLGDGIGMLRDRLYEPWGRLGRALRTNRPTSFDSSLGELFDYLDDRGEEQEKFVSGQHALSLLPARALARRFSFRRFRHLADLGGGSGVYAIEAARRFPHLRATVVERAPICRIAQEYIRAAGMEERVTTEARNFFRDPLPEGVDVALLSHVVHDFSPQENVGLLRRVAEGLPAGGVLLVSEWLWREDRSGPLAASLMALNMMVDTRGGRSYSFGELRELLQVAGFRSVERKPLFAAAQLVVARKG